MNKIFASFLFLFLYTATFYAQNPSSKILQKIENKGFGTVTEDDCDHIITLKMYENGVDVLLNEKLTVKTNVPGQFEVGVPARKSIWYKIIFEQDRDFNFSLFPAQNQNLNFVLYRGTISCSPEAKYELERAVLIREIDAQKGIGLTGESTSNYADTANLDNILFYTPYHKSAYAKSGDAFYLHVLNTKSYDFAHILSIGSAKIQVSLQAQATEETTLPAKKLKDFLYGKTTPAPEPEPEPKEELVKHYEYDSYLYQPENEVPVESNITLAQAIQSSVKKGVKKIKGTISYQDGTLAKNTHFYVSDATNAHFTKYKTNESGTFNIEIPSNYVFFSMDANEKGIRKGAKVGIKGTIESNQDVRIFGNKQKGPAFEIDDVILISLNGKKVRQYEEKVVMLRNSEKYNTTLREIGDKTRPGIDYRIQVGAFVDIKNFTPEKFAPFGAISSYDMGDGIVRYTVGKYDLLNDAEAQRQKMIQAGLTGIFVIAFENGKRKAELR